MKENKSMNYVLFLGTIKQEVKVNHSAKCDWAKNVLSGKSGNSFVNVPITIFGDLANKFGTFKIGDKLLVEGELTTGSYQNQNGTKTYTWGINVNNIKTPTSKEVDEIFGKSNELTPQDFGTVSEQPKQVQKQQELNNPFENFKDNLSFDISSEDLPF